MMKPHVKKVLNLWKESVLEATTSVAPYQMSQQLRSFAALFAPGSFYYYVLNFPNLELEFVHEGTREVLGLEPEEVSLEKLVEVLIPEEREPMAKKESVVVDFFINFLEPGEITSFKSVYFFRIRDMKGQVHDMLHQATVLSVTECNKPEHVLVVHTDVSHLKFTDRNTLSLINLNGNQSYCDIEIDSGLFDPHSAKSHKAHLREKLTKREIEIIKLIGNGYKAEEISQALTISVHTVRTHRKNILKKTQCKNTTELVAKCLVEGVI